MTEKPPTRYFKGYQPMPVSVNCQYFRDGYCMHYAAVGPRSWFGKTRCIEHVSPIDPRVKPGCALRCEYPKPAPPPKNP